MKLFACEMCNSTDLVKENGLFVCQHCGMKYSPEEAKKMMIEGTVDVQGTVKVDNTDFVQRYLQNARRAKQKEDWEETEKYYNMVEQNDPRNIEAVFYSAYGKARTTLQAPDIHKRIAVFKVFANSISVIDDYFDPADFDTELQLVKQMSADLLKLINSSYTLAVLRQGSNGDVFEDGTDTNLLFSNVNDKFIESLENIIQTHPQSASELNPCLAKHRDWDSAPESDNSGCLIAIATFCGVLFLFMLLLFASI